MQDNTVSTSLLLFLSIPCYNRPHYQPERNYNGLNF
nr:MAG TPA: Erm Leader peptide [Caudoviricetes sp.]